MTASTIELPPAPPPPPDPALQYRMQRVFADAEGNGTLDGEPIFLRPGIENDDSALDAFGRLLGHFYDGQPGESFVLLGPGGRLLGVF